MAFQGRLMPVFVWKITIWKAVTQAVNEKGIPGHMIRVPLLLTHGDQDNTGVIRKRYEKLYDPHNHVIDRVGLQGDAMTVSVCTDNPMIDGDIKLFRDALSNDDELIGECLSTLSRLLKEMGY